MLRRLTLLVAVVACTVGVPTAAADPTELFFSEYIEGSSNNKALELYNGTGAPINLATGAYNVHMIFNGGPTTLTINLTGSVANGDVHVVAHSSADAAILAQADQTNGSGWFNGNDVVLLRKGTTVIDAIGQTGTAPATEWGTGLTSTADNTLQRKPTVQAGDTNPDDAFDPATEWNGFAQNTFSGLGSHSLDLDPVTVTCGGPLILSEGQSGTRAISATDGDGVIASLSLTDVAPTPAAGSISLGSVTLPGTVGGAATGTLSVSNTVPPGTYVATIEATNGAGQSATCTVSVTVTEVLSIGEVQGVVGDLVNGATHRSPLAPASGNGSSSQLYDVRGVITQKSLQRTNTGASQHGFFLQSRLGTDDGNPLTSDGIFVFMGGFTSLIGGYTPQVGDEVILRARVAEFFFLTQLSSASLVQVLDSTLDVNVVTPAVTANPPDLLADANRYWERLEGMRIGVPAGSRVTDGLDVFPSTADSEMWVMRGDEPVANRADPYAERPFRDAHPLDNIPNQLFDDGNGYRILVGPTGLKALAGDNTLLLPPSRTFSTVTNTLVGALNFSFSKYRIETTVTPALTPGVDPSLNNPPQPFDRGDEYGIADYNVENLYDFRDDPFDGCDFVGNLGCPGVSPPFDYVPASDAVYQARLGLIAEQIIGDLHEPDIVLAQEAEDQDICTVTAGALTCGTTNDADGKPDTLQELALRIAAEGGPAYDAAYDRDGSDDRGIVSGFLYRTDRVELVPADADHPVLGSSPEVDYRGTPLPYNTDVQNPKALNADLPADVDLSTGVDGSDVFTRDPQVGLFRVWRQSVGHGAWVDVVAISNHFSSTPNARVGQRTEQANYNAAIVEALEGTAGGDRVLVGGDFNTFPKPDDPLDMTTTPHQLEALYAIGLTNLWDVMVEENPAAAYSYVFVGQAQTLDGQFVSETLLEELGQARVAHVNADFPADYPGDGARGLSDHDPMLSTYELVATIEGLQALLDHYLATGALDERTYRFLKAKLDRVAEGGPNAAGQLRGFIGQVEGRTPQWIDPDAAAALIDEAERLLEAL